MLSFQKTTRLRGGLARGRRAWERIRACEENRDGVLRRRPRASIFPRKSSTGGFPYDDARNARGADSRSNGTRLVLLSASGRATRWYSGARRTADRRWCDNSTSLGGAAGGRKRRDTTTIVKLTSIARASASASTRGRSYASLTSRAQNRRRVVAIPVTARRTARETAPDCYISGLAPLARPPRFAGPFVRSFGVPIVFARLPDSRERLFSFPRWQKRRDAQARVASHSIACACAPLYSVSCRLFTPSSWPYVSSPRCYRPRRRRRRPPRCPVARSVYSTRIARASPHAVDAPQKEDETKEGVRVLSYANIG